MPKTEKTHEQPGIPEEPGNVEVMTAEELEDLAGESGCSEETVSEETISEETIKEVLEKLQAEKNELINSLQRLQADFENFRRRTRLEKEEFYKYASEGLLQELLPVMDNFERALAAARDGESKNLLQGVEMIFRQLLQVMEKEGVETVKAVGCPFDPAFHEAVMQVEDEKAAKDTVLEEMQKGYTLKGKLLRPSMVKVAR